MLVGILLVKQTLPYKDKVTPFIVLGFVILGLLVAASLTLPVQPYDERPLVQPVKNISNDITNTPTSIPIIEGVWGIAQEYNNSLPEIIDCNTAAYSMNALLDKQQGLHFESRLYAAYDFYIDTAEDYARYYSC